MRIDDEFLCDTAIEIGITPRCLIKADHRRIHGFGDGDAVVENGHHQRTVVLHDGGLPGGERQGLGPTETKSQTEIAAAGGVILRARVLGDVQAGNSNCASGTRHVHELVEYNGRLIRAAVALGLEADTINCAIDLADAQDSLDVIGYGTTLREVQGLATE